MEQDDLEIELEIRIRKLTVKGEAFQIPISGSISRSSYSIICFESCSLGYLKSFYCKGLFYRFLFVVIVVFYSSAGDGVY